jgi:hypothetical protein
MLMMNLPRIKSRCCATYLFLVCQEITRKVLHHLNYERDQGDGVADWAPISCLVGRLDAHLLPLFS